MNKTLNGITLYTQVEIYEAAPPAGPDIISVTPSVEIFPPVTSTVTGNGTRTPNKRAFSASVIHNTLFSDATSKQYS